MKDYFYGPHRDLAPAATTIYFRDVQIYRVGADEVAPLSALPIGVEAAAEPVVVSKVTPSNELRSCILAVSYAQSEDELLDANIAGFLHVQDVQVDKAKMMVLAPSQGELPGQFLLVSDVQWFAD